MTFETKPWNHFKKEVSHYKDPYFLKMSRFFTKALAFKTIKDVTFYPKYRDSVIWFKSGETLTTKNHTCVCYLQNNKTIESCFFCALNNGFEHIESLENRIKYNMIDLTIHNVELRNPPCNVFIDGIRDSKKHSQNFHIKYFEANGPFILRPLKKMSKFYFN